MLEWLQHGLTGWSVGAIVVFTLVVTHVTIVAVTVYLHRHSAHRALELHPALKHFFRAWLWLTTGMGTLEWTAIHRKHHATCETEEDPHSPQVQGLKTIFWRGVEVYREAGTPETLSRYGAGCPDDWLERSVYQRHASLGIALMFVIDVALFGFLGITVWAVQMAWIPVLAAGVINGVGHYWGYRNFECNDAARNIVPWGILIGGEELHNNHHTYPNSAKLSAKWWEFDIGWAWIRLFQLFGLAKPRSRGPMARKISGRDQLDMDTAWAVLNARFQVMAAYAKNVLKPAVRNAMRSVDAEGRQILKRARKSLYRSDALVSAEQQVQVDEAVALSAELKVLYELRESLQQVWSKRADAEALLKDLADWCAQAEASGVQALNDFVAELRSYAMPRPQTA